MRIGWLRIERFRSIRSATLFPVDHNVYLGPNSLGKTPILEALNLVLNPEIATRGAVVELKIGLDAINSYKRLAYIPWHALAEVVDNLDASIFGQQGSPRQGIRRARRFDDLRISQLDRHVVGRP